MPNIGQRAECPSLFVGKNERLWGQQRSSAPHRRKDSHPLPALQPRRKLSFRAVDEDQLGLFYRQIDLGENFLHGHAGRDGIILTRARHERLQGGVKLELDVRHEVSV